jgi:hypothetical protein
VDLMTPDSLEYNLSNDNPLSQAHARAMLFTGSGQFAIIIALAAVGWASSALVAASAAVAAGSLLFAREFRGTARGTIRLDCIGLVITTGVSRLTFDWTDISSASLRSLSDECLGRTWVRMFGGDPDRLFVDIRPRRSLRVGFLGNRYGTNISGIPIGARTVRVYPDDPEEVAGAIAARLADPDASGDRPR